MNDELEVFEASRRLTPAAWSLANVAPWASSDGALGRILARAPIIADGESGWNLHPDPARASRAAWRTIVAVRSGTHCWDGALAYDAANADDRWRHLHGLPPAALAAFPRAVFGEDVIDVAACELVSERPPRRLIGLARVLGIDPSEGTDDAEPVAVHRTVASWLAARCSGIVLLGSAEERQATLLACRGGVIGDSLAHAEALRRLMVRPQPAIPPVFVGQHGTSASRREAA